MNRCATDILVDIVKFTYDDISDYRELARLARTSRQFRHVSELLLPRFRYLIPIADPVAILKQHMRWSFDTCRPCIVITRRHVFVVWISSRGRRYKTDKWEVYGCTAAPDGNVYRASLDLYDFGYNSQNVGWFRRALGFKRRSH